MLSEVTTKVGLENVLCYKIVEDPLIYCIPSGWGFAAGLGAFLHEIAERPAYILVACYWSVLESVQEIAKLNIAIKRNYPYVTLTFMCMTRRDQELLLSVGVSAIHCHINAFVDEKIYHPQQHGKEFAAVYVANTMKWKRHDLAWNIGPLALITYEVIRDTDLSYVLGYKNVTFSNIMLDGSIKYLQSDQVTNIIGRSRCGLILSEVEGGNFASMEYLLCGVPVVSTPSIGGRHVFFDARTTLIAPPRPEAVESAVRYVGGLKLDPTMIRAVTIEKMIPHRRRLLDWLGLMCGRNLHLEADENAWWSSFHNKLRKTVSADPAPWLP